MNIIERELQKAITFKSEKEIISHSIINISLNFMHIIEQLMKQKNISKKELSKFLKISQKALDELFSGDKIIDFKTLAIIERLFKISFDIKYISFKNL